MEQKQNEVTGSNMFKQNAQRFGLVTAISGTAVTANAAAIDVSSVVTTITDGVTTVSAIGLAVLSLVVVIKVFKWARSAM
jgi:hypothetical protein